MRTRLHTDSLLVTSIPVATTALANATVVHSIPITALANQIMQVSAAQEVTMSLSQEWAALGYLCLGTTPSDTSIGMSGLPEALVKPINGFDIQPASNGSQVHAQLQVNATYQFTSNFTGYVNFVIYSYASGSSGQAMLIGDPASGTKLYGDMSIILDDAADCNPAVVTGTLVSKALTFSGTQGTCTGRQIIPASVLTIPSGTVTKFRVTFASAAGGFQLMKAYIGPKSGSYAFSSAGQLLFSGSAVGSIPANGTLASDWVSLAGWNKTSDLVVSYYHSAASEHEPYATDASYTFYYLNNTDDASNLSPTGYSTLAGYLLLVTKVESDGF